MSDKIRALSPETHEKRESVVKSAAMKQHWDDIGVSRLFVDSVADKAKFSRERGKWLLWNGKFWETDTKERIGIIAQDFAQSLYKKIADFNLTTAEFNDASRQIKRSNSNSGLKSFLELSKAHLSVMNSELDCNPYLLNCKNGTIDLRKEEIRAHSAADLITKCVPFDYEKDAKTPNYDKFITTVQRVPETVEFIKRSIGYSLLGIARERAFWILYGNGNNGKSVFIDLWSEILGDYASATTASSVMNSKNDRIPNDIARLAGKRFIVIPETEENERLNASLIKALSAGDKITARFLFGEFFDFYFSGKLWIATNHKPGVTDHSKGFWDRLKLIPFEVDIPKEQVIKRDILLGNLLSEAGGILAWAVRGCREYFEADSLGVPAHIQNEIDDYKYDQDSIAQFVDECCAEGADHTESNKTLYQRYSDFCKDNGEYTRSQRRFTQNLKERGFTQQRNQGGYVGRYWEGIMLKT